MKEQKTNVTLRDEQDMAPLLKWASILKDNSYWLMMSTGVVVVLAAGILIWNMRKEAKLDEVWSEMAEIRLDPLSTIVMKSSRMDPIWKTLGVGVPPRSDEVGNAGKREQRERSNDQRLVQAQVGWSRLLVEQGKKDPILIKSLLERAKGTDAEPWVMYHLGSVYYARAEYEDAVEVFEGLSKRFQNHCCGNWASVDLERTRAEMAWKKNRIVEETGETVAVEVETTVGRLILTLYREKSPELVDGFLDLVRNGKFEGMMFYTPTEGASEAALFCGDPNGNGTGSLAEERPEKTLSMGHGHGTVGMDIAGPGMSSGSRFYITQLPEVTKESLRQKYGAYLAQIPAEYLTGMLSGEIRRVEESRQWVRDNLDGKRSIVGVVTEGLELLSNLKGQWIRRARIVPEK
ncbi:MAG: peptidylprolyl isomerase [Planctomycetota bacterium]|jgi:cyclophilin family peptidyl-prolyl cis-trans isomerase|nr:peptidylprolyl isomerase [Planctomycetota bacterium]